MGQYIAFFSYFAILLVIGLISHRKRSHEADFIMGARSMNYWVTALSAHSSDMSAWIFMGLPGAVFFLGMPQAWVAIGLIAGMWLNWYKIAPRLRQETEQYNSVTLPTFFEKKFGDTSGVIRILSVLMSCFFLTAYLTAMIVAMGVIIEGLFGLPYSVGILVMMPVLMTYVFVGGFVTVAWVDFFQGIFLFGAIAFVPLIAYLATGGFSAIDVAARAKDIPLNLIPHGDPLSGLCVFLYGIGWGLGYFGQPHIITKFMGIRSVQDLKKSMYVGMSWQIIALACSVLIGIIGIGFFPLGLENRELVFIDMVKTLFSPFFASFLVCGVIAANMSTIDSQVLAVSSMISEDLFRKWFPGKDMDRFLLMISRLSVIVVCTVATTVALTIPHIPIMTIVEYAWCGLGATFGPVVIAALFGKHVNRYGVIAGLVVGALIAAFLPFVGNEFLKWCIIPIIPAFIISSLVIYFVSKMTSARQ